MPMEKKYYDVDYRYNAINNTIDDKTREISREQFMYGKEIGSTENCEKLQKEKTEQDQESVRHNRRTVT